MKITVLAGGLSPERNVSLSTGSLVAGALKGLGHQVALVDMFFGLAPGQSPEACFRLPLPDLGRHISAQAPDLTVIRSSRAGDGNDLFGPGVLELCRCSDIVFIALHGQSGEDGRVQAAFDLMGIPYTGAGYLSSAIAMDKDLTKRLVAPYVKVPEWKTVSCRREDMEAILDSTALPCVIKPVDSGSSIGVFIAHDRQEARAALEQGMTTGGRTVLEQYIQGREIQVGILDGKALPAIEIIPKKGFYDYENKYQPGAAEEICPAPISPEQAARVAALTEKVFAVLGLSVYARADFILDEQGTFWFLEINTLPGMTPTSLLPQEAAVAGLSYAQLCQRIIDISLRLRGRQET